MASLRVGSGVTLSEMESWTCDLEACDIREGASLVPQMVKNLPAMWETWVQSLGQEYPLEKGMATHSSILGASLLQISLRSSGHQFQCMWEGERQVSHFDKQFSNTSSVQFSCLVMSDSL